MYGANIERVRAQTPPAVKKKLNVAILVFEGVQIIDYTGPYEVLGSWGRRNVYTVAEKPGAITTNMGMIVVPNYTFADQPVPDVIVLPGGGNSTPGKGAYGVGVQMDNKAVIDWVRKNAGQAKYVLSVCNGAFLAAKAGLLENLEATTTAGMIADLKTWSPTTRPVFDRRFVDTGKVITTAGLSSGIDGALHLVEKLDGSGWAKMIALSIEYNWQPESGYARAALADSKFPDGTSNAFFSNAEPLDFKGGRNDWEEKWLVRTGPYPNGILPGIDKEWSAAAGWSKTRSDSSGTYWKLTEAGGSTWNASAEVQPAPGDEQRVILTLKIARNR